jgi:hypothetical protein
MFCRTVLTFYTTVLILYLQHQDDKWMSAPRRIHSLSCLSETKLDKATRSPDRDGSGPERDNGSGHPSPDIHTPGGPPLNCPGSLELVPSSLGPSQEDYAPPHEEYSPRGGGGVGQQLDVTACQSTNQVSEDSLPLLIYRMVSMDSLLTSVAYF